MPFEDFHVVDLFDKWQQLNYSLPNSALLYFASVANWLESRWSESNAESLDFALKFAWRGKERQGENSSTVDDVRRPARWFDVDELKRVNETIHWRVEPLVQPVKSEQRARELRRRQLTMGNGTFYLAFAAAASSSYLCYSPLLSDTLLNTQGKYSRIVETTVQERQATRLECWEGQRNTPDVTVTSALVDVFFSNGKMETSSMVLLVVVGRPVCLY